MMRNLRKWILSLALAGFALAAGADPHVRVSGTWQEVDEIHARVSGTWQEVDEGWVKVSGTWQQFYAAFTVTLDSIYTASAFNGAGGDSAAGVRVKRDGNISVAENDGGTALSYTADVGGTPNEWADPPSATIGDAYHVRMLRTSGTLTAGTDNTWLALTSDRTFENTQTGLGTLAWVGVMQISDDGGSTVLAESPEFSIDAGSELP